MCSTCLFPPKIRPLALSFLWIPWNSSNMLTTCLQHGPTFRMYILFVICLYCVDIFSASFFFKLPTSSSILPRWTIAVLMHRRGEEGRETVPKNGLKMVARCCMSRVHFFFALYLVVFHSFSMFSLAWCRQPKVLATILTTVLVKVFASSDKLCLAFARPWLDRTRTRIRWTRSRQKKCLHPSASSASSASASLRWVDGRVAALCGADAEIEILKIFLTLRNIMDYYCRIWEWAAENLSERNLKCWKYRTYKLCVTLQLRGPKILKRCIEKVIENFDHHETLQTLQTLLLDVSEGSRAKCSKERAKFTDSPEWIWMDLV